MKFAKELEQDLVPEWRVKYLDYRAGKKYVKNIARAISRANGTPRLPGIPYGPSSGNSPFSILRTNPSPNRLPARPKVGGRWRPSNESRSPSPMGADSRADSRADSEDSSDQQKVTTPMLIPKRQRSNNEYNISSDGMQYGSFVPTPPRTGLARFQLPDAALQSGLEGPSERNKYPFHDPFRSKVRTSPPELGFLTGGPSDADHRVFPLNRTFAEIKSSPSRPPLRRMSTPSGPTTAIKVPLMQRMFSTAAPLSKTDSARMEISLRAYDQVKSREADFFRWMDKELNKVESFYKIKEGEAGQRLKILQDQLHEMRNRRIEEIAESRRVRDIQEDDENTVLKTLGVEAPHPGNSRPTTKGQLHAWIQPIERILAVPQKTGTTQEIKGRASSLQRPKEDGRDYVRRTPHDHEVPYRSAKRKLKLALKEFYRGLELLKSYALLNRIAFRKINKKYDKAVNSSRPLRYMSEKVNKAWFVQSDVLDSHLHVVEDLYARYFEHGNRKVAMGKLRGSSGRPREYTGDAFRCGFLVGTGAVFAIQGLVLSSSLLHHHPQVEIRTQTSYLLQIYAGYFLALYLLAIFCLDCRIWVQNKINYIFIFEFDAKHHLDWRELAEFPAFLALVLGLFIWLNFSQYGPAQMFIYYPVILIFVTAVMIFLPVPILFHRSRRWFVYSHWRLLLAGFYPVEFRDFFLGDMYCSLTYFMGSIELFFCLYAQHWSDPPQCGSTHSRLLGFLTTLPGIWRALQCLRRYYDTRAVFPHLLNCGKYVMTIIYYMSLSLYRIEQVRSLLALFITFAAINAVYCSIWDLAMDWSLCQPYAKKWFLRDIRGYKSTYYYYVAMVIDVILRFNWVFYIFYTHDARYSSLVSFLVAFSEITRRGIWTLFRVENEHCANVSQFKASRDIPLPYPLSPAEADTFARPLDESSSPRLDDSTVQASQQAASQHGKATAVEEGQPPSGVRRRALTLMFAEAHTQDFEKRKTGAGDSNNLDNIRGSSDEDDEEEEVDQDVRESMEAEMLTRSGKKRVDNSD